MRRVLTSLVIAWALASRANAGMLTISTNSDVVAGRSAYIASVAAYTQFDWELFPQGASTSLTANGHIVERADLPSMPAVPLYILNWVDAPGFDGNDLALNGDESFDLRFGSDQRSVGLAVITGTGVYRSEVDFLGATFRFTAFDAADAQIGFADVSLAAGVVDQAWVTLTSTTGIRRLTVRELAPLSDRDQYFSDIFASSEGVASVPEPSSFALLATGGLIGALRMRRRNAAA